MKPGVPDIDSSSDHRFLDEEISKSLIPVLHILDSFNHRNKNQHRVARWWTQFDLLRRSVRRLEDALVLRLRNTQARHFKKPKQQKASKAQNALDDDITARVQVLLNVTIPSSFLAFTQLTADNQHAALGLVLLGVLASINTAIAPLAPQQSEKGPGEVPVMPSAAPLVTASKKEDVNEPDPRGLGVVISRDQLRLGIKTELCAPESEFKDATKPKKRKVTAALDDIGPVKPAKDKKAERKPKKKTSKKGDEFSDLFSSLM
ncbi:uncharacterized protein CTRU02_212574 [Colletotrichum truncatum]|uniref:Uncharacterized protein n=1 Tax=Colletotrichum truncatum TaxID=5467 RepID=A0ACC3YIA9_COLTU|nr:uncharacterized protein CTRU02_05354 [Colletotrichum truncatum]KAF6794522.1 hypothetical protein CTRU02_05354 [Colletotrichum truncatum]